MCPDRWTGTGARNRRLEKLHGEHVDKPVIIAAIRYSVGSVVVELAEVCREVGGGEGLNQEFRSACVRTEAEAGSSYLRYGQARAYPRDDASIDLEKSTGHFTVELGQRSRG